jgi:hypothetical protein
MRHANPIPRHLDPARNHILDHELLNPGGGDDVMAIDAELTD